ncbi:MAG: glycosyltransferase family 4 protein [Ardenticatenaceae bacterium]|nr:glycosyltransferase family 4 protein [Ardenticatenaceae bacterium]
MNIIFVSPRYLPAVGGAEVYLATLAEYLAQKGHQVTVATTTALDIHAFWDRRGRLLDRQQEEINGVQVRRFPLHPLPGTPLSYRALRRGLWLLSRLKLFPRLARQLAKLTPSVPALGKWLINQGGAADVICALNITYEGLMLTAGEAARQHRCPFVVIPFTHLGAGRRPGADSIGLFYTMRQQIKAVTAADFLIGQTPAEVDFYAAHQFSRDRALVAGPGIFPSQMMGGNANRARARWNLSRPVVLSLGAASVDKGSIDAVHAALRLWGNGVDFELVIAGSPAADFEAALPAEAHQEIRFKQLGPVSGEEKKDLLAASAMLVMPSRVDSFGIVYLEAWLYDRPVIGAKSWGITDVIQDGTNGLLVPFGDIDQLAQAIFTLLTQPDYAHQLGENGHQNVLKNHTWEKKLPQIERAFLHINHHGIIRRGT